MWEESHYSNVHKYVGSHIKVLMMEGNPRGETHDLPQVAWKPSHVRRERTPARAGPEPKATGTARMRNLLYLAVGLYALVRYAQKLRFCYISWNLLTNVPI